MASSHHLQMAKDMSWYLSKNAHMRWADIVGFHDPSLYSLFFPNSMSIFRDFTQYTVSILIKNIIFGVITPSEADIGSQ